jgi:hypothetical protein
MGWFLMERDKLTRDEWDALLDDEKIPTPAQQPKKSIERGRAIAEEALRIINGERQDRYGNPEDTFKIIGDLWGAYLRALEPSMSPILPEDVANMMTLMKMARIVGGKYCIDNDVDLIGYAMLGADMRRGDHD